LFWLLLEEEVTQDVSSSSLGYLHLAAAGAVVAAVAAGYTRVLCDLQLCGALLVRVALLDTAGLPLLIISIGMIASASSVG
jgi:hypothetical protein